MLIASLAPASPIGAAADGAVSSSEAASGFEGERSGDEGEAGAASEGFTVEAGISASTALYGASSAYLRPGPREPEVSTLVAARPFVGLRSDGMSARLTYAPAFQRYFASQVSGLLHDVSLGFRLRPSERWALDAVGFGGLSAYDSGQGGAVEEGGSMPLVATRSRSFGGGGGARYFPRRDLGFRGAVMATRRSSRAVFVGEDDPEPIEELFLEAGGLVVWRPVSRVEMVLGPVLERRFVDRDRLSYLGAGLRTAATARLWKSGGVDLSLRAQQNVFGGTVARSDLFARASALVWQEVGDRLRLSGRYSYTANGSAVAAYDADRHVLLFVVAARAPTWRR